MRVQRFHIHINGLRHVDIHVTILFNSYHKKYQKFSCSSLWVEISLNDHCSRAFLSFQSKKWRYYRITEHWGWKGLLEAALSMHPCMGWFLPKCRTSHFSLLNFRTFRSAHFSSLQRSSWRPAWPSGASVTPSSFVASSSNLLTIYSTPSSRSVMRMFYRIRLSIDP